MHVLICRFLSRRLPLHLLAWVLLLPLTVAAQGPEVQPSRTLILWSYAEDQAEQQAMCHGSVFETLSDAWSRRALSNTTREFSTDSLSLAEIQSRAARVVEDAVISFGDLGRDRGGQRMAPRDVLRQLVTAAAAPVLVLHDTLLDVGALGGLMLLAEQVGQQVVALIHGRAPGDIDAERFFVNVDDQAELTRWGVPATRLPAGSRLIDQPAPGCLQHADGLLGALLLVPLLLLLALGWTVRSRQQARASLDQAQVELGLALERAEQVQRAAGQSEARLAGALRAAGLGLWTRDLHTGLLVLDATLFAIYGIAELATPDPLPEADWRARVHPQDLAAVDAALNGLLAGHGRGEVEFRIVRPDGSVRHVASSAYLERDAAGQPVRMVGYTRDVTERVQADQQLAEARQAVVVANEAKNRFLATMSHEIRTPLNVLVGTSYLLGHTELDARQHEDLRTIESAGKNLLSVISDVLDYSRIEAGEVTLDAHEFQLAQLLEELQAMFDGQMVDKGLAFSVRAGDPRLPPWLVGDSGRLRQCLVHLLGNALKFTPAGQVGLTVELMDADALVPAQRPAAAGASVRLRFTVSDSGIGMSPEQVQRVFNPFVQADVSTTRRYGGNGLGLTIVKRLALMLGGDIGVRSGLGQGSEFWVDLPFVVAAARAGTPDGQAARRLQLLLAEVDAGDRDLFERTATGLGWAVISTNNGQDLVEQVVERRRHGEAIDCIVLGWQLPQLDGLAVLATLRRQLGDTLPPTLMLVRAEDGAAWAQARAQAEWQPDSVLSQPVAAAAALFNAVNEAANARGLAADHVLGLSVVGDAGARWLADMNVLVVDDSRLNRDVIGRILERQGARCRLCISGAEALVALDEADARYDAVLMDLQMPDMDGCETTQRIRRSARWDRLPVIALTAGATASERQRSNAVGMVDFLTKPVDPAHLVRALRRQVVRTLGLAAPRVAEASRPAPAAQPVQIQDGITADAQGWPQLAGFDMASAAAIVGDPDFFRQMLAQLVREQAEVTTEIKDALARGDNDAAARLAHRLRGQAGNLGAVDVQRAAGQLDDALRSGRDDVQARYDDVCATVQIALDAARRWLAYPAA
ncbi:MAG: hypothetical protein RIQ60_2437 [Pseudomonadota bacterium]|jgi:signal transduction histidine kinase/DNA-binding response OmpR family regulator/HPt (histidine-containing phosphotransfer) domain-containing protein